MRSKKARIGIPVAFAAVMVALLLSLFAAEPAGTVSAKDFEQEWPLTVDSGRVLCDQQAAVFVAPDGTEYALNGVATSRGYTDIGPLINAALERC